jgi:hypothetical protein
MSLMFQISVGWQKYCCNLIYIQSVLIGSATGWCQLIAEKIEPFTE